MIWFAFILSLLATLTAPILAPSFRLFFFAPYLVLVLYKKELSTSLWQALICGLILDLLTSGNRLGLLALNFTLTTLFLYQLKPYFFVDRLTTLPLMTFLFATLAACLQIFLNAIFQGNIHFSTAYISWDLLYMPACDAFFTFLVMLLWHISTFKTRASI